MTRDSRIYKIDLKRKDVAQQFGDIFKDIFARHSIDQVQGRIDRAVDREIGKIFQVVSVHIMQQNFTDIEPYTGSWPSYSDRYERHKISTVGHLDWFKYGRRRNRKGKVYRRDPMLMNYLVQIPPSRVLSRVGYTSTTVSKDKKKIIITMLPRVRMQSAHMEDQFSTVITRRQMRKLKHRVGMYRNLIGPEFAYMLNERIPILVQRSLRRF